MCVKFGFVATWTKYNTVIELDTVLSEYNTACQAYYLV